MSNHKYIVDKSDIAKLLRGEPLALVDGQFSIEIMQNMTNGDMMQAVFPDIEMWGKSKDTLDYSLGGMVHRVMKSWWNAEYKGGKK